MNRLPNEILLNIFENHVKANGRVHNLIRVCTHWNDLVTRESRLWTFIWVDVAKFDNINRGAERHALEGLANQLERSRELPLSIWLIDSYDVDPPSGISSHFFCNFLAQCYHWKIANLVVSAFGGPFSFMEHLGPHHCPSLVSLSLEVKLHDVTSPIYLWNYYERLLAIFQNTPSLFNLRIPLLYGKATNETALLPRFDLTVPSYSRLPHISYNHWSGYRNVSLSMVGEIKGFFGLIYTYTSPLGLTQDDYVEFASIDHGVLGLLLLPELKTLWILCGELSMLKLVRLPTLLARLECRLERLEVSACAEDMFVRRAESCVSRSSVGGGGNRGREQRKGLDLGLS
ncbi:hypothetical protein PM082_022081 [Marasmius tenuissimus]|nr:hypothetical protein PM082_022081 [Marasmius tenuissimus]